MQTAELFSRRKDFYLNISPTARGGVALCLVIGLVALVMGVVQLPAEHVWGAVLFNLFFFFSIALGGIAFSAMQEVVSAVWGRPIKRIHESFAAFLPVAALIFIGFLLCVCFEVGSAHRLYEWIVKPELVSHLFGKGTWLQKNFMVGRDLFAVLLILVLAMGHLCKVVKRDQTFINGDEAKAREEGKKLREKLQYWSAPVLILYALCFSLLAFDLLMSLSPLWFSTLWAGWMFAIMMQTLCASLLIAMFVLKDSAIGSVVQRSQFHDVGKLLHGFTIFFAYLTYAHILTYWYGNMPEETEYFLLRMHKPWIYFVIAAPFFSFAIPFFSLIFKASKWTAGIAIPIASVILGAQWVAYMIIVMPQLVPAASWQIPLVELGIFLLFLGLFLSSVFWFGRRYPMVGLADPLLPEALSGGHH